MARADRTPSAAKPRWSRRQRIIRISPITEEDGTVSRRYLVLLGKWVFRVQ